jgi:cysteine desulfurase/selenocysteine lyase
MGDGRLVYLDTAATSQKPAEVIAAQTNYYRRHNANVHRGMHTLAAEATEAYEGCRVRVGQWLDTAAPENVVITHSATAALNMVAHGLEQNLTEGDEILLTQMEHHANLVPWLMLAQRRGIRLRYLPVDSSGKLNLGELPNLLGPKTKIFSFTHVSNVLGTINPVGELAAAAHKYGTTVVLDAAQAVGHFPLSFRDLGVDILVFSAHKCYGPMGLGFLLGTEEVLQRLDPLEGGGEMIEVVEWDRVTWADVPHRFEAGTPNVAAAAAFPPAVDLLEEIGLQSVRAHERDLVAYAWERLGQVEGLVLYGPSEPEIRGGLISFSDPWVHPHDMATLLDRQGIAIRAGHHCAQPLHRRLGVVATCRASFGVYSSLGEIDALVEGILTARKVFRA